jgi:hypothetical protein
MLWKLDGTVVEGAGVRKRVCDANEGASVHGNACPVADTVHFLGDFKRAEARRELVIVAGELEGAGVGRSITCGKEQSGLKRLLDEEAEDLADEPECGRDERGLKVVQRGTGAGDRRGCRGGACGRGGV